MKALFVAALLSSFLILANTALAWEEVTSPPLSAMAAAFAQPPKEYSAIHWALGFPPGSDRILSDIEHVSANGGGGYMINSGGKQPKYLSPEYFALMKTAVDECKKRGLKMWIDGDDGYPDGFAGGLISKEYPQLGMQGIVADAHCTVAGGQTVSFPLPTDTLGIFATQTGGAAGAAEQPGKAVPVPADGKLTWLGPSGSTWEVAVQDGNGVEIRYSVVAGQTLSIQVPPGTKSIQSATRAGGGPGGRGGGRGGPGGGGAGGAPTILPVPGDGQFKWTAPGSGTWDLTFVRHLYRSSPTRYGQREDGSRDKDSLYCEIDYLDPQATATYIKLVPETYGKYFGDEFGKTILGFRCDETDYTGFSPWTPKLLDTFKAQKGYDLQPYIASMFATPLTAEAQRVKADYWDVWSVMFRDNFYKPMEDWCRAHHMDYMSHLNHEETMTNARGESMITNEGSFWRDMRFMGVPGVDNLNQIGPGIVADFPKIAASAAHVDGRPQGWSEEGGSTGAGGKFVADYQLVRGLNYMNISGLNNAAPAGKMLTDRALAIGWYVSRAQYLLANGRPGAQVALYHPTDSYWMGDYEADTANVRLVTDLMEHQIDFDHIDEDGLATVCTLEDGGLKNLSGQVYKAVIIPSCTVMQKNVLDRLRAFAAAGGKVVCVGRLPTMLVEKSFLHPEPGAPDLSFATIEPAERITDRVVAALPKPDFRLDSACAPIKYIHRVMGDGDVYFVFNESAQTQTRTATLNGVGQVQVWDAGNGTIHPLTGVAAANGTVNVPLVLGPQESRFIVVGPLPAGAAPASTSLIGAQNVVALDGNWSIALDGTPLNSPLKSWRDLGAGTFTGIADYNKTFAAPASLPPGKRLYLDLGEVREAAQAKLNGIDLGVKCWPSYVWDVTDAIKPGDNTLEVQVQVLPEGGRGGGGGAPAAGGRAPAGGGGAAGPGANPAPGAAAGAPGANGAGAGRGAAGGRGAGRGPGGGAGTPATQPENGLIGPVRVIAQ